jgi:uncharacterized RDD family membrane protein YckC
VVEIGGQSYCGPCKEELVRDLKSGVSQSPELATRSSRFGAQVIDNFILGFGFLSAIGSLVASPFLQGDGDSTALMVNLGIGYVALFVFAFVYEWKMVAASGQTLGKRALGIQVVSDDGSPLGNHAWKRPLWRYLFTFMSCIGLIDPLMIFSERNRTLHDRLAKTLVIRARR